MQGRRIYPDANDIFPAGSAEAGDYWKAADGSWAARLPNGLRCGLRNHTITEHADGTITVAPSILVTCGPSAPEWDWHGYLERGIWRLC